MQTNSIIRLTGVDVYQQENLVLADVQLTVRPGEWIYLIGKVGSGKSSLIKVLHAELDIFNGEAWVAGFNLRRIKRKEIPLLRRKVGVVFQDFRLLTDRTVRDNLAFVLKATGWKNTKAIADRIREVADWVGMARSLQRMPHELSGGEQQRVVIARAILNDPEIILADEPTGNLDPETTAEIMKIFVDLNRRGKTIVMATHDYPVVEKYKAKTLLCADLKLSNPDKEQLILDFSDLTDEKK
ncbi:cell division ATP-binding protein FtsE [Mangrovibacterium marinum]|uniref:Cell division ATP-binding protein FtsE n=1 Tax=Mangrovibacterium marinum TaxID=1639118 RepID=A0A2T5C0K4_9BACT|nr:ATP-binding cassette domain-containing protein [Mangrovibacterium marinum]PTN08127.1 cell division transport system ATP-binding protein [Mangrovibacterium marinum]